MKFIFLMRLAANELWEHDYGGGKRVWHLACLPIADAQCRGRDPVVRLGYHTRDTPFTIGLDRLLDLDKPSDFIGKEALQRLAQKTPPES
jgi:aminomethyltransferase